MGLNLVKPGSNMYQFINATFNIIKGACFHDCSYCYMKRWGKLNPPRFDNKELKTDLGSGNFIFVGSSIDIFAENIQEKWIVDTLDYLDKFDNRYLIQTKNPARFIEFMDHPVIKKSVLCVTLESDSYYPDIMHESPNPISRSYAAAAICELIDIYITIEPIMQFDLERFVGIIKRCNPKQINIGCDSGRNNLPEPSKEKVLQLISELEKFTVIHNKSNLKRLLK